MVDELFKARKAKGLENWQKFDQLKEQLAGKTSADITYTCSHPSHEGQPVKHVLGSVIGNLHFLQGYGNPNFHMAEYHWMIIDPQASPEDVAGLEHPSKPEYWAKSGLEAEPEGDTEAGSPNGSFSKKKKKEGYKQSLLGEIVRTESGMGMYLGIPSLGVVYGLHNGMVYKWALLKNSFFAYSKPNFAEAMNSAEESISSEATDDAPASLVTKSLYDRVSGLEGSDFAEGVYPLVKSLFPSPGSLVVIDKGIHGIITTNSIDFVDLNGNSLNIDIFDRTVKSVSLLETSGDHPSILMNISDILNVEPREVREIGLPGTPRGEIDG